MEHIKVSGEDAVSMKAAIDISNRPEIKREILCTVSSDYDASKGVYEYTSKMQWSDIVEKKAKVELKKLHIAKHLQEKVLGILMLVGMRMLTWAEYHEGTLGFPREYSYTLLNKPLFTHLGVIDNKKAAEELMNNDNLNTKQKYKLACLYCFKDHIPALFRKMTEEDEKEFYNAENLQSINQPGMVNFWSYYLMNDIDKLKGDRNLDQYRLEAAVESGSMAAVEYCLKKINTIRRNDFLVDAAMEAVRCQLREVSNYDKDWVVFRHQRYKDSEESWVPSDYYLDILCLLLSKMGEDQKMEFLKRDVEGDEYEREFLGDQKRSRVLKVLLNWPYQDLFMKTVGLVWEFLPEKDYAVLLLRICDKIKPRKKGNLRYGEERSYDYRDILREFWHQSPERYKRYVFSNEVVGFIIDKMVVTTKAGVKLITKLLTLKNFSCKDRKNIELILASTTEEEKCSLFSSQEFRKFCISQMEAEKWEMLDMCSSTVFLTKDEEDKFKKELCFTEEAKETCILFIKTGNWNAAESFIRWSSLSEEDIKDLKKEMIYSDDGMYACVYLITPKNKLKDVDKFIQWCFTSEKDVEAFRKELLYSINGTSKCVQLIETDEQELAIELITFGLSSKGDVMEFKKYIARESGSLLCEDLISERDFEDVFDDRGNVIGSTVKFNGGKWEQVEKFLTWCFPTEEEINDFKTNVLLKQSGTKIHFNLVQSSRFDQAETFFAWLGLTSEGIKKLKMDTLFDDDFGEMFGELMYSEKGNTRFVDYGTREEAIELLLRWYGADKETLLEYQKDFKHEDRGDISSEDENVVNDLDLIVERRLNELDEEEREVRRQSEASSTQH